MTGITIWHNPRCTKSRETLGLLQAHGITPEVRLYLEDPPTREEITAVLALLGRPAADLLRWKEAGVPLGLTPAAPETEVIAALATHPRLIERPVVIRAGRARIGRPPDAIRDLL